MTSVCWWCIHPFDNIALHAPYKYDDRRRTFLTTGHFCSWECVKAYLLDKGGPRSGEFQMYLALMKLRALGKNVVTKAAPKRLTLKLFGGPLTIEEFRSGSSSVDVFLPNETHMMPTYINSNAVPAKKPNTEGDEVVLKRPKPLARAKSTLETSLGITRRKSVM